jgi:hypothetical protein
MPAIPDRIRIGVLILDDPQRLENVVAAHVRQVQVKQNDVVIVQLAKVDAFFAKVGRVDIEPLRLEHQLDALRCCRVVFDQQNSHHLNL